MTFSILRRISSYKTVFALAFPMVLSNITVPLLGLVDVAVIGHLEHPWYLGGVALGSTMISVVLWLLGFLRMSTTGLAAQAWGAENKQNLLRILLQGIGLSCFFSGLVLLFHTQIIALIFSFSDASHQIKVLAEQYFSIRIWSLPAALINLVVMGWLLGTQNATKPMLMVVLVNSLNIVLDVIFVLGLDLKVQGVAGASVVADYSGALLGLYFVVRILKKYQINIFSQIWHSMFVDISRLIKLNRDIFIRSLCLQAAFSFMTFKGATLGVNILAANAVLMNFLLLVSFAMDGFAYAMEAMVGKAIGAKNKLALCESLITVTFSSIFISLGITLLFVFFGTTLVDFITDLPSVRSQAYIYLPWLMAIPLASMWCFLLDGIFIGATRAREMRNAMFVSMTTFFVIWWYFSNYLMLGNHALWAAMTAFMIMRGITLGFIFCRLWRRGEFLAVN